MTNHEKRYDDQFTFTKEERRWYALGALKAALLIGLAYAAGLGLVILILLLGWGAFSECAVTEAL